MDNDADGLQASSESRKCWCFLGSRWMSVNGVYVVTNSRH